MKNISLVIPCYKEAKNIPLLLERLETFIVEAGQYSVRVICVNDGSPDNTLALLIEACLTRSWLTVVNLTRNFGKEAALSAGLDVAAGDAIVFMDGDLQHPPEVIHVFLRHWEQGSMVVAGRRRSRDEDSPLYKRLAQAFYWIHNKIADVKVPPDVGDFRLIDGKVAEKLRLLRENRRFMKGLFAWVGYEATQVEYEVAPRPHGSSSFNKWRAWNLALEGITSFSTVPLRLWTYIGGAIFLLGVVYASWIILSSLLFGVVTPGYATLLTTTIIFGGVQLIGVGILGEYIGRIYVEVKGRPPYLIERIINGQSSN